jgi:predicted O-methyltransferase YrrM
MDTKTMTADLAMIEAEKWVEFNKINPETIELNHPPSDYTLFAQSRTEIKEFAQVLEKMDKRDIALETGVFYGGTFFFWKLFFDHVIGIDINPKSCEFVGRKLKDYGCDPAKHNLVCGDAHNVETEDKIKEILQGRKVDLLFIDGSHSCRSILNEFLCYGAHVRSGGIIAIHDVGQEAFPVCGHIKPEERNHLYSLKNNVWVNSNWVFTEMNCCAVHLMRDHERYGVSRMQFIHPEIHRSGIGWCIKK